MRPRTTTTTLAVLASLCSAPACYRGGGQAHADGDSADDGGSSTQGSASEGEAGGSSDDGGGTEAPSLVRIDEEVTGGFTSKVTLSPDARFIAANVSPLSGGSSVIVLEIVGETMELRSGNSAGTGYALGMGFTPDGSRFYVCGGSRTPYIVTGFDIDDTGIAGVFLGRVKGEAYYQSELITFENLEVPSIQPIRGNGYVDFKNSRTKYKFFVDAPRADVNQALRVFDKRELGFRKPSGGESSMRITMVGLLAGVAAAAGLTTLLQGMLFGVGPHDPTVFVAAPVALGAATLAAAYLPTRRASTLDPVVVLRE